MSTKASRFAVLMTVLVLFSVAVNAFITVADGRTF
jgi:hypothetical protein